MENFWKKLKQPIIALAPMAGVTDAPFRLICREHGADILYSEMASSSAIFFNRRKTMAMLKRGKKEKPYVVQLFGDNPSHFRFAAEIIRKEIKPEGIDINFGCPARKVISTGSGAVLMNNIKLAREIIEAVLAGAGKIPVSIKIRAGAKKVTAIKFVRAVRDLPLAAIMVHGRTLEQGFAGEPNYEIIKKVKSLVTIPVLANGGIMKPEDAKVVLERTGADGLGLARGVLGKPWLFRQTKEYLKQGKYEEVGRKEIEKLALRHAKMMLKAKGPWGIKEMRKHLAWYFHGFPGASELRQKLVLVNSIAEVKKILSQK